jgi:hypothetical protein
MNELNRLLNAIEGHEFAIDVDVASDPRTAIKIATSHVVFQGILAEADKDLNVASVVLARLFQLSSRAIDLRFASPWDSALLALLELVVRLAPQAAHWAAVIVAKAPNLLYAKRLALSLLEVRSHTSTENALPRGFRPCGYETSSHTEPFFADTLPGEMTQIIAVAKPTNGSSDTGDASAFVATAATDMVGVDSLPPTSSFRTSSGVQTSDAQLAA